MLYNALSQHQELLTGFLMSHESHNYVLVFQVHTRGVLILIVTLEFLDSKSNQSLVDQVVVKLLLGEVEVAPVPCGAMQAF
jgi:hypothetical protein